MSSYVIRPNESPAVDPGNLDGNHLELACQLPPAQFDQCVECGKAEGAELGLGEVPRPGYCCERCGARLHDTCYFKTTPCAEWEFFQAWDPGSGLRVAPDAEQHFYILPDAKYLVEEHGPYAFICRWCRS